MRAIRITIEEVIKNLQTIIVPDNATDAEIDELVSQEVTDAMLDLYWEEF